MASSHRSTQSISTTGLQPPEQGPGRQQRRMTSPAGSLNLPDEGRRPSPRPPSPLRNGFVMDSSTGIDPNDDDSEDEEDDPGKWKRSPSPSSSVSNLAASFVQRVNNFVGGIAPKSPGAMPTDAELEAQAEWERERSRREAEAILTKEAQQRQLVEDRVLAMMESTKALPPPPSRSQTMPNPPSPSNSSKETNWWTAAKNRLTPTKDKDLTPAQQVIQETKAREKEKKGKGKEKEKERSAEWPANPQTKYNDPAFANLHIPIAPPTRKPVPPSPSSPTPSRPSLSNMAPNLTPSPMRTSDSISSSPSREAPPIYAQFNPQGALDVPGTLLAIAKRFEKLEKWTVGHVRALEERMNDVEKWLVDKEKEKDDAVSGPASSQDVQHELQGVREELSELQGRLGELGREMAKMVSAPSNLSSGPKAQMPTVSAVPQPTTSMLVQQHTGSSMPSTPHTRLSSITARESTSPPMASSRRTPSGTRLPYPQGDYASPPDAFSPPSSPPGSMNSKSRTHSLSVSGLPNTGSPLHTSASLSSLSSDYALVRTASPTPAVVARAVSPSPSGKGLPPPKSGSQRQTSVSPTPRKRYTVALGGPIVAPDELSSNAASTNPDPPKRTGTPRSFSRPQSSIESTFFSSTKKDDGDDDDEDKEFGGETIGKSAAARLTSSGTLAGGRGQGDYKSATSNSPDPSPLSNRRLRAQSAYGFSSIAGASGSGLASTSPTSINTTPSVAPLKLKARSKSTERLNASPSGTGDGMVSALGGPTRFIDPLVLRKQSRDSIKPIAMPKPIGKVPIGQLVKFFDGERDKK